MANKKRICYVVCYKDPNYTRTASLINALSLIENTELKVVRNRNRNIFRYIEVPLKLLAARLSFKPDVFIAGFRANEIFWALWPAMIGKKIIFDEFVNLHDWLINEHHKLKPGSLSARLIDAYMRWVTTVSAIVLTDTKAHAVLAQHVYDLPASKTVAVPVGADESMFKPMSANQRKRFEVFYYGTALPLHGVPTILEAIKKISAKNKSVHFAMVGGKGNEGYLSMINNFRRDNNLGETLTIEPWVNYTDLPSRIAAADLCLGGPFGGTGQARRVISGKTYQFLAMRKATVVGKVDEETELKDKQNCLVVEQKSAQELADAILWSAKHRAQLLTIGQEGRKLYEHSFSAVAISKKLERIIND